MQSQCKNQSLRLHFQSNLCNQLRLKPLIQSQQKKWLKLQNKSRNNHLSISSHLSQNQPNRSNQSMVKVLPRSLATTSTSLTIAKIWLSFLKRKHQSMLLSQPLKTLFTVKTSLTSLLRNQQQWPLPMNLSKSHHFRMPKVTSKTLKKTMVILCWQMTTMRMLLMTRSLWLKSQWLPQWHLRMKTCLAMTIASCTQTRGTWSKTRRPNLKWMRRLKRLIRSLIDTMGSSKWSIRILKTES